MIRTREPVLKHRRARRQHEERHADGPRQKEQQPAERIGVRRSDGTCLDHEGQHECRRGKHRDLNEHVMLQAEPTRCAERVAVAGEHHDLEEHDAAVPHHRHAAKDRQHHLGRHRLDQEQQEPAEEHGRGEQRNDRERVRNNACRFTRGDGGSGRYRMLERRRRPRGELRGFHRCPRERASTIPTPIRRASRFGHAPDGSSATESQIPHANDKMVVGRWSLVVGSG